MKLKQQKDLPDFDREAVFAAVDASNKRFDDYSKEERRAFVSEVRAQQLGVHEARRLRH